MDPKVLILEYFVCQESEGPPGYLSCICVVRETKHLESEVAHDILKVEQRNV